MDVKDYATQKPDDFKIEIYICIPFLPDNTSICNMCLKHTNKFETKVIQIALFQKN